jgi:hypothetical protein
MFQPPYADEARVDDALRTQGFAVLRADALARLAHVAPADLDAWHAQWDDLPLDTYLRDGGRYRRRRHACFVVRDGAVERAADRPHWQPVAYNALHGGIERHFATMPVAWTAHPAWQALLAAFAARASRLRGAQPWFVEAHPFRIDTTGGIGRPTPEGAHRDGVDLVVVILVRREGVSGGETRVFEAGSPSGVRFTLTEPWTTLVLDDERMVHETTPIQPADAAAGHRDTLVLTYRAGGFQGPGRVG